MLDKAKKMFFSLLCPRLIVTLHNLLALDITKKKTFFFALSSLNRNFAGKSQSSA